MQNRVWYMLMGFKLNPEIVLEHLVFVTALHGQLLRGVAFGVYRVIMICGMPSRKPYVAYNITHTHVFADRRCLAHFCVWTLTQNAMRIANGIEACY